MKKIFLYGEDGFAEEAERIVSRGIEDSSRVAPAVSEIMAAVKKDGDEALLSYTATFDKVNLTVETLKVSADELKASYNMIPASDREALELSAKRIRVFHEKQLDRSWITEEAEGVILGQRVTPLDAVGLYVPGGKASYPSTVLMNAIPAKVAGVGRLAMVSPTPGGVVNHHVQAAAYIAGVDELYRVGGAQAVAALAFGTESIAPVDKIVGPGNIYVATAKQLVYGRVDIDMIAGPSEIFIVSDGSGNPSHIAADLLSQAEHDELATCVLATTDGAFAEAVALEVEAQLLEIDRGGIARKSWEERGAIFLMEDLGSVCDLANNFASEHLELAVENPFEVLTMIRHAGAIFLGHNTPEALGDYAAGPNHVLPTAGTARFNSPLGVEDFIKRSSLISFSREALEKIGGPVAHIARMEGLDAHARAVEMRLAPRKGESEE
ncbi:MAG: histidinol dehydrogenase [Deltaproteobacteria bacterium]|nr:MAG: histidinol dehydrogenase [Deltaproteobacteria bacterium]